MNRELARRSLAEFIRQAWPIVEPETKLVWNWHLDAMCEHLEAVADGRIRNLALAVPPGHMKSLTVSVFWPAWMWIRRPAWRVLFASYSDTLILRDAVKTRMLIESRWYRRNFAEGWRLAWDQNVKHYFANTKTGFRISTTVGGAGTGHRADCIAIDDALHADDAFSKCARDAVIRWWRYTMRNRLNDMRTGSRVIIGQRLHEEDLTGYVLREEKSAWEHFFLPSRFEPERRCMTSIGWSDPRTTAGELLFPEKFPAEVLDVEERVLGSLGWPGQHQQRPSAVEGGILKRAYWKYLKLPQGLDLRSATHEQVRSALGLERIVQSWDTAHTEKKQNDYNSCHTFGQAKNKYISLDVFTDRMEYPELKRAVQTKYDHWCPDVVLVEDKAAGLPVVQELRRETRIPFHLVTPKGDKVARASACTAPLEAGLFWLVEGEPWVDSFVESCANFPNAAHDDDVDAFTQGAGFLTLGTMPGQGWLEVARAQMAEMKAGEGAGRPANGWLVNRTIGHH